MTASTCLCVDLATVLVSLVVEVSGTVALPMEQIANVRFMILILYGRTHKRHTIDAVVVLGTTADENLRGYATTTTPSTCIYCKYYSSTEILLVLRCSSTFSVSY